jgi:transglutaminase superfamily protein
MRKLRLAGEILFEYLRAGWTLRRHGLEAALAAVPRPSEADDPREHATSLRMGRAVDRTLSALPSDPRCLIRAVVLARVLARRGIGSRLVVGVRAAPEFTAHAWVEHLGAPLLPAGDYLRGRLAEF